MTNGTSERATAERWECNTWELRLIEGTIWSSAGISGRLTIECVEGTAWITEEGSSEDIILEPGGCCMTSIGKLLVIESLSGHARLRLEEWSADRPEQDQSLEAEKNA